MATYSGTITKRAKSSVTIQPISVQTNMVGNDWYWADNQLTRDDLTVPDLEWKGPFATEEAALKDSEIELKAKIKRS